MNDWKIAVAWEGAPSAATILPQNERKSITASAYKHRSNEAPAVLGSNHTDLSISSMHYSPHTAILPPRAAGKDWFHFLFICFHPLPSFPPPSFLQLFN